MSFLHIVRRSFSTTPQLNELRLLSRVKVVDNSKIGRNAKQSGRPVKVINVYKKPPVGRLGDKVLVTIEHEKKKAYIVGCKQRQQTLVPIKQYGSDSLRKDRQVHYVCPQLPHVFGWYWSSCIRQLYKK